MAFSFKDVRVVGAALGASVALIFGRSRKKASSALVAGTLGYAVGAFAPGVLAPIVDRLGSGGAAPTTTTATTKK